MVGYVKNMKRYILKDNKLNRINKYDYFELHGAIIIIYLFGILTGILIGIILFK